MITGDHAVTAQAIGKQLGLTHTDKVLTGTELDALSDEQLKEAVRLYPGSGRLNFRLAELAETIGEDETALAHYLKAVEIEDSYRVQFRIMYPDREMFSRLGEKKYRSAMERIGRLGGE